MDKKRLGRSSAKAQITIFIILGLLLLAVFLFLFYLVSTLAKSQLMGERERLQLHAFQKEALRIYLDDCLSDELEMGLLLLGKQGRLWDDQPGGRKFFEEGRTGLMLNPQEQVAGYHSGRVAYAITNESSHYFQHFNAYPCNNESFFSQFCQYTYPDTTIGFGLLPLRSSTVEGDLQRFMENRTLHCLSQWLHLNISQQAVLQREEVELKLRVHDEGIGVTARYPLRFTIGRQEFFHLANFDFFYPTEFKRLLDVAALSPLQWDQKFIDFNYTLATLQQPTFQYSSLLDLGDCTSSDNYFLCRRSLQADLYQLLSLQMRNYSTPWGDDVFEFTAPVNTIIRNQPYTLRIARQNRPPALDYLQRWPCLEPEQENYDYFVVKEHPDYGDINLTATALDPDEDVVRYGFSASPEVSSAKAPGYPENNLYVAKDNDALLALTKGFHYITVAAYDGHQSTDEQMVRIFVDRNIKTALTLESPYFGIEYELGENSYIVSREDPVFMKITVPLLSADPAAASLEKVDFVYDDRQGETTTFKLPDRRTLPDQQEFCYNLPVNLQPQTPASCQLDDYGYPELEMLNPVSSPSSLLHPFRKVTPLQPGKLTLGYGVDYCGNIHLEDKTEVEVTVAECVPLDNPKFPYPYMTALDDPERHYQWKFELKNGGTTNWDTDHTSGQNHDQDINPFLVTHKCCQGDPDKPGTWEAAPADTVCFDDPAVGCYGQAEGVIPDSHYVLEKKQHFCDGISGNRCGGPTYVLNNDQLQCGRNNDQERPQCRSIADQCQNAYSFGLVDSDFDGQDDGWCYGEMGCQQFCSKDNGEAIVYEGDDYKSSYTPLEMNQLAKSQKLTDDDALLFHCGCAAPTDHKRQCDADFDGTLDGACNSQGKCEFVCGPPGSIYCKGTEIWQCNSVATEEEKLDECDADKFCDDSVTVTKIGNVKDKCKNDVCTANGLACYTEFGTTLQDSLVAAAKEYDKFAQMDNQQIKKELEKRVYACQSDGSGWDSAAECASTCNDQTILVDTDNRGFDHPADGEYACGCGGIDSGQKSGKDCMWKGSKEVGKCQFSLGGSSCSCPLSFGQC